jgi:hypothetical protein
MFVLQIAAQLLLSDAFCMELLRELAVVGKQHVSPLFAQKTKPRLYVL